MQMFEKLGVRVKDYCYNRTPGTTPKGTIFNRLCVLGVSFRVTIAFIKGLIFH